MGSAHAHTLMVGSMKDSGLMESMKVLGYYRILLERSLLECFEMG